MTSGSESHSTGYQIHQLYLLRFCFSLKILRSIHFAKFEVDNILARTTPLITLTLKYLDQISIRCECSVLLLRFLVNKVQKTLFVK